MPQRYISIASALPLFGVLDLLQVCQTKGPPILALHCRDGRRQRAHRNPVGFYIVSLRQDHRRKNVEYIPDSDVVRVRLELSQKKRNNCRSLGSDGITKNQRRRLYAISAVPKYLVLIFQRILPESFQSVLRGKPMEECFLHFMAWAPPATDQH